VNRKCDNEISAYTGFTISLGLVFPSETGVKSVTVFMVLQIHELYIVKDFIVSKVFLVAYIGGFTLLHAVCMSEFVSL
jgi:hypothetical protein